MYFLGQLAQEEISVNVPTHSSLHRNSKLVGLKPNDYFGVLKSNKIWIYFNILFCFAH